MITYNEATSILLKAKKFKGFDDLDFHDEYSEEFVELFEYKDKYYINRKTKQTIRLYARTWKFGRDPVEKSHLWRVTIQPVINGVVKAEDPIYNDWCEKDKVLEYMITNPKFKDFKEMKSAPKRKPKSKV